VKHARPDAAVLDMDLNGVMSVPVADALANANCAIPLDEWQSRQHPPSPPSRAAVPAKTRCAICLFERRDAAVQRNFYMMRNLGLA
jgi:hypothetical protein